MLSGNQFNPGRLREGGRRGVFGGAPFGGSHVVVGAQCQWFEGRTAQSSRWRECAALKAYELRGGWPSPGSGILRPPAQEATLGSESDAWVLALLVHCIAFLF